jgi:hypothetical protein
MCVCDIIRKKRFRSKTDASQSMWEDWLVQHVQNTYSQTCKYLCDHFRVSGPKSPEWPFIIAIIWENHDQQVDFEVPHRQTQISHCQCLHSSPQPESPTKPWAISPGKLQLLLHYTTQSCNSHKNVVIIPPHITFPTRDMCLWVPGR